MKLRVRRLAFLIVAALSAATAFAHDFTAGAIKIDHPWSRAIPPGAPVAGGYLKIENKGSQPDRLLSIASGIAGRAELHESSTKDGVASMRPLGAALDIPAGGTVELASGGIHIMFIKPTKPLKEGDRFAATLTFENAGPVNVEFVVQGMGSRTPQESPDHVNHGTSSR